MVLTGPETTNFVVDSALDISVDDFYNATVKLISKESHEHWDLHFSVSVFPDGVYRHHRGWVEVFLKETVHSEALKHEDDILTCTVSIIDVEGNSRFPQSFTELTYDGIHIKYLERFFILNRADELLSDGVLTLRCDISYTCTWGYLLYYPRSLSDRKTTTDKEKPKPKTNIAEMNMFYESMPNVTFFKDGKSLRVFDLTLDILTLPPFHELRKPFGVYEISGFNMSSVIGEPNLKPNEDRNFVLDDVWMLDIGPDRFLMSLKSDWGSRLLEVSPFIKSRIHAAMKEEREKRIILPNVDIQTFKKAFCYLRHGEVVFSDFSELVSVHEMALSYGMKDLQRDCLEELKGSFHLCRRIGDLFGITGYYTVECKRRLQHLGLRQLGIFSDIGEERRHGKAVFSDFSELVSVHEMALSYGMKDLQRDCLEELKRSFHLCRRIGDLFGITGYYTAECKRRLQHLGLCQLGIFSDIGEERRWGSSDSRFWPDFECYV
ncbi:hypothetical protein AVEN_162861-1 [Araneus ventricosus]|uniref:BTB domain-containing protein n=1 Tax=Araneus ventricosus TaxID=182803 RepID=A0A4Y2C5Y1_ARAVE|nr:hypothetical protein AVEN_162861-1 [Araneus ventricosus]